MTPAPRPPRALEALVRGILGGHEADRFILGDLREEYARRPSAPAYALRAIPTAVRVRAERVWTTVRGWARGRGLGSGRGGGMGSLGQDARFGVRGFLRRPSLTLAVVATLGVGIGATTAVVSAVRGMLLAPLPYAAPEELAVIQVNTGGAGWYGASAPEYLDMERDLASLEGVAAFTRGSAVLGDSLRPRRVGVSSATAGLLPLLGVAPALGRAWTAAEDDPAAPGVVVLSHGLWRELFAGDPAALGRTVTLGGGDYRVVGVMPQGFAFPDPGVELWRPAGIDRASPPSRANHYLTVVARRRPGVALDDAAADLERFARDTRARFPDSYATRGFRARVTDLHAWVVGPTRVPLLVLLGTAALVLVMACANVANLLLARGEARRGEMALRAALGAGQGRLLRQLLTETGVLALAGGAVGVAVAVAGVPALVALAPEGTPRLDNVALDAATLGWAALLTALTGMAFGLLPALRAGDAARGGAATGGRRLGSGRREHRARRFLLVLQVAVAAVLAVGTGLMVRTLRNLYATDLGLRPDGVLTLTLDPPAARYPGSDERVAFYRNVLERVEAVPGVVSAAATCTVPMTERCGYLSLLLEGGEGTAIGDAPDGVREIVTPGWFGVLGVRAVAGRLLGPGDGADAPLVAVVNETFAREMWPGLDPVGRRFRMWSEGWPYVEVVGLVGDVRGRGPDQPAEPTFYVPFAQAGVSAYGTPLGMDLVVRSRGAAPDVAAGVREAVRAADPSVAISSMRSMDEILGATVALRRFTLRLLEGFAAVALFLAAVGVYGVMSVTVGERRREIGLRLALGAAAPGVVGGVVREGLVLAAAGCAVGLGAGIVLARWMDALLFGVSGADPATLVTALAVIVAVAGVASALPAWRAGRVDPMVTLRAEG